MRMLRLILGALLVVLSAPPTHAATYYWNPASGNDSYNGCCPTFTSGSNGPWKSLKQVRNVGLTGGNTVNIVVGNYTRSQYQALANDYPVWNQTQSRGSAGAPLIIQSDPAGGGTRARFDGEADGLWVNFVPNGAGAYYIIIQNIEFQHYTGGVVGIGNGSTAFGGSQIASRIAVIGNYMHDLYQSGASTTGTIASDHIIFKDNIVSTNAVNYTSGAADHIYYLSHGSQYIVVDNNYSEKIGGHVVQGWGNFDASWSSINWIIRRNTMVNTQKSAIIAAGSVYNNIYAYNNTCYNEANTYPAIAGASGITSSEGCISFHLGQTSITNTHVKNNLSYGYVDAATVSGLLWSDSGFSPTSPFELDYNWWGYVGGGGSAYRWLGTAYTSNAAFQAATIYGDNDKEGDPKFTNPAAGFRDFTLQPTSPAIDAGTTLTTANGAGTASNSLTVFEAGYFHDGYGLIAGDTIQVGSVTTTITGISGNVLTVSPAISWSNGAAVSLPYNGSKPDMGAFETTPTAATQLAITAQPVSTTPATTLAPIVVQARKTDGSLDTTSTAAVTLTLSGGPGFFVGALAGETQVFLTPQTGRYVRLVSVADLGGSPYTSAAEIAVFGSSRPIAQAGTSVTSVSSQDPSFPATNALDSNTSTYWYSKFTGGTDPHPHTLVLDLGATYAVNGWTYLPFQDPDTRGRITQYTLEVSTNGTTWGTALTDPQLTGTLTVNAVAGVATFSTLQFGTMALNYRLTASSPGLTAAQSTAFDITQAGPQGVAVKRTP